MSKENIKILLWSAISVVITLLVVNRECIYSFLSSVTGLNWATAIGSVLGGLGAAGVIPFTVYWYKKTKDDEKKEEDKNLIINVIHAIDDNAKSTIGILLGTADKTFSGAYPVLHKIGVESGGLNSIDINKIVKVKFEDKTIPMAIINSLRSHGQLYEATREFNKTFEIMMSKDGWTRAKIGRDLLKFFSRLIDMSIDIAIEHKVLVWKLASEFKNRGGDVKLDFEKFDKDCVKISKISERIINNLDKYIDGDTSCFPSVYIQGKHLVIVDSKEIFKDDVVNFALDNIYLEHILKKYAEYGDLFRERLLNTIRSGGLNYLLSFYVNMQEAFAQAANQDGPEMQQSQNVDNGV